MNGDAAGAARRDRLVLLGAIAGALVALVIGIVVVLADSAPRLEGSNSVPLAGDVRVLKSGQSVCQAEAPLPKGMGRLRLFVRELGEGSPSLRVRVRSGKRVVRERVAEAGWPDGPLDLVLKPFREDLEAPQICVANMGPERAVLSGYGDRFRAEYLTARSQSWWARVGLLNERFPQGKSEWYGGWSLPIAFILVLAAGAVAVLTVLRSEP